MTVESRRRTFTSLSHLGSRYIPHYDLLGGRLASALAASRELVAAYRAGRLSTTTRLAYHTGLRNG